MLRGCVFGQSERGRECVCAQCVSVLSAHVCSEGVCLVRVREGEREESMCVGVCSVRMCVLRGCVFGQSERERKRECVCSEGVCLVSSARTYFAGKR